MSIIHHINISQIKKFKSELAKGIVNVSINAKNIISLFILLLIKRPTRLVDLVFVVDDLSEVGGIESRLSSYCAILEQCGYTVSIISRHNNNNQLKKYLNIYLDFGGSNYNFCFSTIVKYLHIKYIEFQSTPTIIMSKLDYGKLHETSLLGYVIHGIYVDEHYLDKNNINYVIAISDVVKAKYKKLINNNITVIPNGIVNRKNIYRHNSNNQALLISRIDEEKFTTICSFIEFCQLHKLKFKIAGSRFKATKIINNIKYKYSLKDEVFIGTIETINFLNNYKNKYLFVAGVGLVLVEAASLGYPIFLCSHLGYKYSCFVNKNNFSELQSENFTIKNVSKSKYYEDTKDFDYQEIKAGKISKYNLYNLIKSDLNFEKIYKKYIEYIHL